MIDYESIDTESDLFHSAAKLYDSMQIKTAFILFIVFVMFSTDIFAERVLNKLTDGSYDSANDRLTSKGIIMTGMLISVVYILIDLLVQGGVI